MTNPGNAIGTNGAFGGRTSPNALNDVLGAFSSRGVLSGWGCVPQGGMVVHMGGSSLVRDVAIAESNIGNRVTINNISESPVPVTIPTAPTVGSRIDSIVAYVNNPPQGTSDAMDNPGACGIIVVSGTAAASNPAAPTDANIRTAITADGASGNTAYYAVLAQINVPAGATDITASNVLTIQKPTTGSLIHTRLIQVPSTSTSVGTTDTLINTVTLSGDYSAALCLLQATFEIAAGGSGYVDLTARLNDDIVLGTTIQQLMYINQYMSMGTAILPFLVDRYPAPLKFYASKNQTNPLNITIGSVVLRVLEWK